MPNKSLIATKSPSTFFFFEIKKETNRKNFREKIEKN